MSLAAPWCGHHFVIFFSQAEATKLEYPVHDDGLIIGGPIFGRWTEKTSLKIDEKPGVVKDQESN